MDKWLNKIWYVTFIKALITFIFGLVALTAFLLMVAAGENVVAAIIAITGVMLLVWLWSPENYGGKK